MKSANFAYLKLPNKGVIAMTLTDHQQATVTALLKGFCPDQGRHDGIRREISKTLGDDVVTDSAVLDAVYRGLVDHSGVFIPPALFPTVAASPKAAAHKR
jgi:hypothetical protein